jgi:AAA family ATP:ADP antiporter
MLFAVGFLEAGLLAARRLLRPSNPTYQGAPPRAEAGAPCQARRPLYQMGLGLWTFLFTTTSAFVYMEQARIVDASIGDAADRTAFFARIDLMVNVVGLILQVSTTGRILALLGAGGAAALLPALTLAGSIVLALRPTIVTVQWFQVARRAADYAIARPSREVFYTALGRAELSRTKSLIDTAVYRAGDAAGAWAYGLLAAIPGVSWAAPLGIVPLSILWIVVSLGLGRALRRRLDSGQSGP